MTILFDALSDPRRRELVDLLREGELPVGLLVDRMPIAQSGVSRHLRILKDAGVVRSRGRGQQRLYSLCPEPFEALDTWLQHYRALWDHRMDNFGAALAQLSPEPAPPAAPKDSP